MTTQWCPLNRVQQEVDEALRAGWQVEMHHRSKTVLVYACVSDEGSAALFALEYTKKYPIEAPQISCLTAVRVPKVELPDIYGGQLKTNGRLTYLTLCDVLSRLSVWMGWYANDLAATKTVKLIDRYVEFEASHYQSCLGLSMVPASRQRGGKSSVKKSTNMFCVLDVEDDEDDLQGAEAAAPTMFNATLGVCDVLGEVVRALPESNVSRLMSCTKVTRRLEKGVWNEAQKQDWILRHNRMEEMACVITRSTERLGLVMTPEYDSVKHSLLKQVLPRQGFWSMQGFKWAQQMDAASYSSDVWIPLNAKSKNSFEWAIRRLCKRRGKDEVSKQDILTVAGRTLHSFSLIIADKVQLETGSFLDNHFMDQYACLVQLFQDALRIYDVVVDVPDSFEAMHKSKLKDLGELCSLMSLIYGANRTPSEMVLREWFARQPLWWGTRNAVLITDTDEKLDDQRFDVSRLGGRQILTCRALSEFLVPSRSHNGRTCLLSKDNMRSALERIYNLDDFKAFVLEWRRGSECESQIEDLPWMIERAVYDSRDAQYHDENTNFGRISRRRGCKLLQRGETQTIPVRSVNITMRNGGGGILCAACHVYSAPPISTRLTTVSYDNAWWTDGSSVMIRHSGDARDKSNNSMHNMYVDMETVFKHGGSSIYLTLSACGVNTLGDFAWTQMDILDQEGNELVCYRLDESLGRSSSAVIAEFDCDSQGRWTVKALCSTSDRRCCRDYRVITRVIENLRVNATQRR